MIVLATKLPEKYGILTSNRQRRRLEEAGLFPKRVPLTARSYGYVEEEIIEYVKRKIAARDEPAGA